MFSARARSACRERLRVLDIVSPPCLSPQEFKQAAPRCTSPSNHRTLFIVQTATLRALHELRQVAINLWVPRMLPPVGHLRPIAPSAREIPFLKIYLDLEGLLKLMRQQVPVINREFFNFSGRREGGKCVLATPCHRTHRKTLYKHFTMTSGALL